MPRIATGSVPREVAERPLGINFFSICCIVSTEVRGDSISRGRKMPSGFTDHFFYFFKKLNSNCQASSAARITICQLVCSTEELVKGFETK